MDIRITNGDGIVNGMEYAFTWFDFGSFIRLSIYVQGHSLGYKDFPLTTDTGRGVVEHTVKSLLLNWVENHAEC